MKKLYAFVFALLISVRAFAVDLSLADRRAIEHTVRAYVIAFDKADFAALKKQVAPEFISAVGGEEHFKKQLQAKTPVKTARQIEDIRIVQKPIGTFVQFNIKEASGHAAEIMEDDDWFRVVKISGSWKLQRHETDFPLESE